ncbi:MAG: hypothetical protein K0Q50_2057 [Vampirovibrio sp.]|jgi:hypothetical protein|nr:hypothetical protein [Vampirovibrio sp.]
MLQLFKKPVPVAQAVKQNVWDNLKSLDHFTEGNITTLERLFEDATDKHGFLAQLSKFCVARPRLIKLIDTPYFSKKHSGSPVYDLIIAACNYGSGNLVRSEEAVLRHANDSTPFFPLLLARIYRASGDAEKESSALDAALERFPVDLFTLLSKSEFELFQGNTANANAYLEKVKPAVIEFLQAEIDAIKDSSEDLRSAIREGMLSRSSKFDVYSDDVTRATWLGYFERFLTQNKFQSGDGFLIDYLDNALTAFCKKENIKAVLDFGSLCAEIIARPAKKLPHTQFIGIDRQEFVATMNYEAYDLPNMAFESGDIIDYLPKFGEIQGKKVFFHVRTTCLLYPALIKKIYSSARAAGVEYIIMWEGDGLSREHLQFFNFDDMPEESIARKSVLFNHNYKAILNETGYEIIEFVRPAFPAIYKDINDLVGSAVYIVAKLQK